MEFYEKNKKQWEDILETIFPTGVPSSCSWNNIDQIIDILNKIGSHSNSNHMFYPTGGGLDIRSANKSSEDGCIEIYTGLTDLLKPKQLLFESFENTLWNYFRIETEELQPTGTYEENNYFTEEVIELETGKYISRVYWDEGIYKGEELPESARILTRYLKGSFVIFAKSSYYNRYSPTYDARHNKMTPTDFRVYIEKVQKHGW